MKAKQYGLIAAMGLLVLAGSALAEGDHRVGVGAHYWTTVDDIDVRDVDEDGVSWLLSYQYWPSVFGVEAAVEWFESGFAGSDEDVYAPQAYLLVGSLLYGAVGIGGYYSDGDWADNPFYAFRAGLNLQLLPRLFLDINANYRFEDWEGLEGSDIDSDTITLGAVARMAF